MKAKLGEHGEADERDKDGEGLAEHPDACGVLRLRKVEAEHGQQNGQCGVGLHVAPTVRERPAEPWKEPCCQRGGGNQSR